ncbi:MAG: Fe(2+)-trafficking protein [Chloroflexota bacterium]|nr:Fe(2+)-trafficking protein [Dehalococcoidia bacterium]MDW8253226.1 Fe(2+)-trafficking protein [Chloroflexota bacterium]
MTLVLCSRCLQTKPALAAKPPGKYGALVQQQVCQECWNEWMTIMPRFINHYGLNLGLPEDRQQLQQAMAEYLNLPV